MMGMSERRGGFALLMVLVALAMLATVLTLRTRQMMERSLVWDVQAREVQTRWAQRTVAQSLAPQALAILGMDEQSVKAGRPPRANWGTTIALGPVAVDVHVSDEQAKMNLLALTDEGDVSDALARLLGPSVANRVRLRPLEVALVESQTDTPRVQDDVPDRDGGDVVLIERPGQYLTFGQVLDHPRAGELMGGAAGQGLAARWTLWGDGRLNVKTADPATLRVMLAFGVDDVRIGQILVALRKTGGRVDGLFDSLPRYELAEEDEYASNRLTDVSEVQGLWVRARSVGDGRSNEAANGAVNESASFYLIEAAGRPRRVQTW